MADQLRHEDIVAVRKDVPEAATAAFTALSNCLVEDLGYTDAALFATAGLAALGGAFNALCEQTGSDPTEAFEQVLEAIQHGEFDGRRLAH